MHDRLAPPVRHALVGYGIRLLAARLGQPLPADGPLAAWLSGPEPAELAWARRQLDDDADLSIPAPTAALRSIFSLIAFDDERRRRPTPVDVPLRPLDLRLDDSASVAPAAIWQAFAADVARLPAGAGQSESFAALIDRYGAAVPGSLEMPGVAVAEQFRAVIALTATLTPPETQVLLVEGDLSGIQEMLYTITSQGAAKNLRGRSLYLQLLCDAIGRALLFGLGLPSACLIFNAGGGFRLLARASDAATLERLRAELNRRLLRLHGGDLALALDWAPIEADTLARDSFGEAVRPLIERLDLQKSRAFAALVAEEPDRVIGVVDAGSDRYCAICHAELERAEAPLTPEAAAELRCDQCASFGEGQHGRPGLARQLANCARTPRMAVTVGPLPAALPAPTRAQGRLAWDAALRAIGVEYRFAEQARAAPGATLYTLNGPDFLPADPLPDCAYGFRFLALATPRMVEAGPQLQRLQAFLDQDAERDEQGQFASDDERERLERDAIRPLTLMARWDSTGVRRYGVLRMDIDNLGRLFQRRLEYRSLLHMAALSRAFTRFFEGWLNTICAEVARAWQAQADMITDAAAWRARMNGWIGKLPEHERLMIGADERPRSKLPYVIYAGGDDLLVIGPWDVLPPLAARIRRDLSSLALRGFVDAAPLPAPAPVTVSAGIAAEAALFPIYQAAEQAGRALNRAKGRRQLAAGPGDEHWEVVKDAVSFLGVTVSWDELAEAERLAHTLARLIDVGVVAEGRDRPDTAPHALIQLLTTVARHYEEAAGAERPGVPVYGRWMPLLAYGLRRMADRVPGVNDALRRQILGLAGEALDLTRVTGAASWSTMRFLALPVRWAQLLIRTGG